MTYLVHTLAPIGKEHRAKLKDAGSNLQFAKTCLKYVTYFKNLNPGMDVILKRDYGLKDDSFVYIKFMNTIDTPKWKNYRSKFKPYFKGTVAELRIKVRAYYEKEIWPEYRKRVMLKRMGIKRNVVTLRMETKLKKDIRTKWHIYFYQMHKPSEERKKLTKEAIADVMTRLYPQIFERFLYFCNIELKRKPQPNEYKLFLLYKSHNPYYPPKKQPPHGAH
jgi:hypothetical protein